MFWYYYSEVPASQDVVPLKLGGLFLCELSAQKGRDLFEVNERALGGRGDLLFFLQ